MFIILISNCFFYINKINILDGGGREWALVVISWRAVESSRRKLFLLLAFNQDSHRNLCSADKAVIHHLCRWVADGNQVRGSTEDKELLSWSLRRHNNQSALGHFFHYQRIASFSREPGSCLHSRVIRHDFQDQPRGRLREDIDED